MSGQKKRSGGPRPGAGRPPKTSSNAATYTLGVRLPDDLRMRLETAARASGRKKSEIVKQAIEKYLENII